MAGSILQPEPQITQGQLRRILDLRQRLARLKGELGTAEMAVRLALEAQIRVEPGPLRALIEDRFDAAQGKIVTRLQIYADLPADGGRRMGLE